MNMLVESRVLMRSIQLLSFLVFSCGGPGLATDPVPDGVILPDDQVCSRTCDCQLSEEDISSVVRSAVESLQHMVIQEVHDQFIHVSDTEEMMRKLSNLEEQVSIEVGTARRDVQAAMEAAKTNLRDAEERLAGYLNINVTAREKVDSVSKAMASDPQVQDNARNYLSHCADVQKGGDSESGIYTVTISKKQVQVYCDLEAEGGGWTVIQRRDEVTPMVHFYRGWDDYKRGFGDLAGEFWLGLDNMHALTSQIPVSLRVDLEDWEGEKRVAEYETFRVGGEEDKYRLYVGGYGIGPGSGDPGDSLSYHNGSAFSTKDRDNDDGRNGRNCAQEWLGAWWYQSCYTSNLNGVNLKGSKAGVEWRKWREDYSLKRVQMTVRPKQ